MRTPETVIALGVSRTLYCGLLEARVSPERCREMAYYGDPCCINCPKWAEVAFNAEDKAAALRAAAAEPAPAPAETLPGQLDTALPRFVDNLQASQEANTVDKAANTQTYTITELAKLIGVRPHVLYGMRKTQNAGSIPGTAAYSAREYMEKHGINWDQVITAPRGYCERRATSPEPESAAAEPTLSEDVPQITAVESDVVEPLESVIIASKQEGQGLTAFYPQSLADYRLEDLLTELTRRLPRAEVVLR